MKQNIIKVNHLTKKFKKFIAADNISFTLKSGTIHGFIGPNGSGKTTTIKILLEQLIPPVKKLLLMVF